MLLVCLAHHHQPNKLSSTRSEPVAMSTFRGIVDEFPEIRIDYFRTIPGRTPPLAGFLSHVHSDHLIGLESLKSPFVYCSLTTRKLLLRLEKYPHRMNFAKGVLEARKQHYKHLRNLLKPIPLNAPTDIELRPGKTIRVTLLDANHCAGAVMFLIEDSVTAILYTGDIRSEPWFVNALIRNPVVIPYAHGHRKLDKIYLDTTFASKSEPHRNFPTKADGLKELLVQVLRYPEETVFHFHAWTPGYEEVWIALASALKTQIHVDRYKMELYGSLTPTSSGTAHSSEYQSLCGFKYGNREQAGCLTSDHTVRLHSCERGTSCPTLDSSDVVWITPIIARSKGGVVIPELGAGGGEGDLAQTHELELSDPKAALELMRLCLSNIHDKEMQEKTLNFLSSALSSHRKCVSLDALGLEDYDNSVPLEKLTQLLAGLASREEVLLQRPPGNIYTAPKTIKARKLYQSTQKLPRSIQFPYSRHSSYDELCHLVEAFKPVDVYPCTVDEKEWTWDMSIRSLFGHLCAGTIFSHDQEMSLLKGEKVISGKTLKRRTGESSSHNYAGSSTEEDVDSDQEHNQDITLVTPTGSHGTKNSTYAVPEAGERPRKHSRISQEPVRGLSQYPTPQMTMSSRNTSKCPHSLQKPADGPRNSDILRKSAPFNTHLSKLERSDFRSSFDGWLKTLGSKPKLPTQGEADPTLQLTSELNTAVFTLKREIKKEFNDRSPSTQPLSKDRNTTKGYRCRWAKCSELFNLLPKLRQHVIQKHDEPKGSTGLYICLWGTCSKLKAPIYYTEELWIIHLEGRHNLNGLRMLRKGQEKLDRKPETEAREAQDFASSPLAEVADDTENPHLNRIQDPAGTQTHLICLSSQETSSSTTASSLLSTTHFVTDDQEATLDNEPAHGSQDSHVSVSTSAFESQPFRDQQLTTEENRSTTNIFTQKIKHRKEACKAAKGTGALVWGEVNLVSSRGGHGELELEL